MLRGETSGIIFHSGSVFEGTVLLLFMEDAQWEVVTRYLVIVEIFPV